MLIYLSNSLAIIIIIIYFFFQLKSLGLKNPKNSQVESSNEICNKEIAIKLITVRIFLQKSSFLRFQ